MSIALCTSFLFACAEDSSTELTDAELTTDSIVDPDGTLDTMLDSGSSESTLNDRGIEDADDLIADLDQALKVSTPEACSV